MIAKIKGDGKVSANAGGNKVIREPVLSMKQLLQRPRLTLLTPKQAEELSEQIQKEAGIYGRG
jgi:hypothetical protein